MITSKVLAAIISLLKFDGKSGCTLSEVSKISGVKLVDVLNEVNMNLEMLRIEKKTIKWVGVYNILNKAWEAAYANGLTYTISDINYGADKAINTTNQAVIEHCKQVYWCGGMGDSHQIQTTLANDENLAFVKTLGLKNREEFTKDFGDMNQHWKSL